MTSLLAVLRYSKTGTTSTTKCHRECTDIRYRLVLHNRISFKATDIYKGRYEAVLTAVVVEHKQQEKSTRLMMTTIGLTWKLVAMFQMPHQLIISNK